MAFASINDIADDSKGVASLSDIADEKQTKSGVASLDDIAPSRPDFSKNPPAIPKPNIPVEGPDLLERIDPTLDMVQPNAPLGMRQFPGDAPPRPLANPIEAINKEITEHPVRAAGNAIFPGAGSAISGTAQAVTGKGQTVSGEKGRGAGAAEALGGAAEAVQPFIGPAAIENPIGLAKGFGVGAGTAYLTGRAADAAGASPQTKENLESAAWWLPSFFGGMRPKAELVSSPEVTGVAGEAFGGGVKGGVAVTPEAVTVKGKVGPFEGSKTFSRGAKPESPALEPPTIQGNPQPVEPAAVAASGRMDEAAQSMARANFKENPPPPAPPPPPPPMVNDQTAQAVAAAIKTLPPEQQAPAILEATQKTAESIAHHGGAVVDGEVHTISTPEQAMKVATKIVNAQISKHDENAPESVLSPSPEKASPSTKLAQSSQEGAVAREGEAEKAPTAITPELHDSIAAKLDAGGAASPEDEAQVRSLVESTGAKYAGLFDASASENGIQVTFTPALRKAGDSGTDPRFSTIMLPLKGLTAEKVQAVVDKAKGATSASAKESPAPPSKESAVQDISKGSRVSYNSNPATVVWASPNEKLGGLRIKMDSGETINVHKKDVKALSEDLPGKPDVNVRRMNPALVSTDPSRMQWRIMPREGIDSSAPFDLDKAGTIDVMRDPDHPGKLLTIDGHHRQTHALNTKAPEARYEMHPEFTSVKQARIWGAIRNIENGNAEPFDAARFIRDIGPEELAKQNINKNSELMRKGMALARLSDGVWEQYRSGDLDEAKAVAIGKSSDDPAQQGFLAKTAKEQKMSAAEIESFSRRMSERGGSPDKVQTLFGEQSNSLAGEVRRARIASKIEKLLEQEKNALKYVSNEARAKVLARAKNVIDVNESSKQALSAPVLAETFRKVQNRTGAVADVLDEASKEEKPDVEKIYPRILEALKADLDRAGVGSSEQVSGQSKGAGPSRSSDEESSKDRAVTPEGAGELFRTADPFYLKSEQLIAAKMPNRATGLDVRNLLVNNGVKADEMKWTGLDDFLRGKLSVTKQQVQDFLRENNVQIKEVTLGEPKQSNEVSRAKYQELAAAVKADDNGGYDSVAEGVRGALDALHGIDGNDWSPETRRLAQEYADMTNRDLKPTKFSNYTLPGGENYRELLLTLPESRASSAPKPLATLPEGYEVATDRTRPEGQKYLVIPPGQAHGRPFHGNHATAEAAIADALDHVNYRRQLEWRVGNDRNQFKSSHFDEPNILAHVRFNDRVDAEGKRTLFIEEVQSDWHQKGRKSGYKIPASEAEKLEARRRELEKLGGDMRGRGEEIPPGIKQEWADVMNRLQPENTARVPDAPFKQTWHELALKRVLRYAAENGYDKIAWTTGEQQNERYDLSKQVKHIAWEKNDDGTYNLNAPLPNGNPGIYKEDLSPNELSDLVGKDIAEKIVNGEGRKDTSEGGYRDWHVLEGDNLAVGGSGMKGFYDKIIPDFLNKYGKKWGAKVGETKIAPKDEGVLAADRRLLQAAQSPDVSPEMRQTYEGLYGGNPYTMNAHALPITESMKKSVMEEGQPLFRGKIDPEKVGSEAAIAARSVAEFRSPEGPRPASVMMNQEAMRLLSGVVQHNIEGARVKVVTASGYVVKLTQISRSIRAQHPAAADAVANVAREIGKAIRAADEKQGVILFHKGNAGAEAEELTHTGQAVAGEGNIVHGVPHEEMQSHSAFEAMAPRIKSEVGEKMFTPFRHVAEGYYDLLSGEAREVDTKDVPPTLEAYYDSVARKVGNEGLDAYAEYLNLAAQVYEASGTPLPKGIEYGRQAIEVARGRAKENARLHGERDNSDQLRGQEGRGGEPGRTQGAGRGSESGQGGEELDRPGSEYGEGLGADELRKWIGGAGKNLEIEPFGEQHSLFGDAEKQYRLIRPNKTDSGYPERHLLTQSKLESLLKDGNEPLRAALKRAGIPIPGEKEPWEQGLDSFIANNDVTRKFAKKGYFQRSRNEQMKISSATRQWEYAVKDAIEKGLAVSPEVKAEYEELIKPFEDDEEPITAEQESESQGTLFRSSLFGLDAAAEKIGKAAGPVASMIGDSLKEEANLIKSSRDLHEGIYDLEKMQEADQLRVKQAVDESTIKAKDDAAIYHWLENPAGERLTPEQQKIYDTNIKPFMDEAERIITKLRGAGALVNNYVHREVKDSGSWLDKVLSGANKSKGGGKGNILSKSAPATKGRTMMAMENEDGKRLVVSVKGGKVTAWDHGMGIDMGGLRSGLTTKEGQLHEQIAPINRELKKLREEKRILSETPSRIKSTFERRKNLSIQIDKLERERDALVNSVGLNELKDQSFIDKNGREWKFDQATTKEIESDTNLKYHHSALGSAATNFLSLRKAERAFDFVEELKNDPGFASIAKKVSDGQAPDGWRQSNIPQLMGYAFEPHHREVLDWYAKKLNSEGPTALEKVGQFLRTAIFFNPLLHVPNLAVHAYVEKGQLGTGGATALLKPKSWRAAAKAVNAVMHQNEDYLAALDEGAPLQSHRDDLRNLNKAIFDKVGKDLDADGKLAENIGKALGYANPVNFLKAWYKLSGYVTWHANDIAYLQSAYEKVEGGMSLRDALKETGKHIPTYRLPTRVLGSRGLAQFMDNPLVQQFSAYHYGALKSYGQAIKSALGQGERPAGESESQSSASAKEVAHGWDILATIGLVTFALYPILDQLVRKASGDEKAMIRRAGASTFPYNLYLLSKGERTPTQVMESVFTPSVVFKRGTEFAFNRNLQTGRQLYDPHAPIKTLAKQVGREMGSSISPIDQATRAVGDDESRKKALWSLAGVSFPKRGAEKLAQEIAMGKVGTQAMNPGERDHYYARKEAIESARKGDYKPLYDAVAKGLIRHDQVQEIKQEAKQPPLVHTLKNFSYSEFMRVWEVATPEEKQLLNKERISKRHNMLKKGRRAEVAEAEATE